MPAGDRTGPVGRGAMTGRGMGQCAGYDIPEGGNGPMFAGRGLRIGRGMGGNGGRGCRNMFRATGQHGWRRSGVSVAPPDTEKEMLQRQADTLQTQLRDLQERLQTLESSAV